MNNPRVDTGFHALTILMIALASALAFISCDENPQVAGTSVGTGNPTEIIVGFKNDAGSVQVTGTMAVYASTQIPVPGFSPKPLLTVPVNGATHAELEIEAFNGIADSLWPKDSKVGSDYMFNVVVSGETDGALLKGFAYHKDSNKDSINFVLREGDSDTLLNKKTATIKGIVTPLVAYTAMIDTNTLAPFMDHYLFIYGSGYAAKEEHGNFFIPKLPDGSYESFLMPVPQKNGPASDPDSTDVYRLATPIRPGSLTIVKGSLYEIVPLPDSLKSP